jgi:hypothetical protein
MLVMMMPWNLRTMKIILQLMKRMVTTFFEDIVDALNDDKFMAEVQLTAENVRKPIIYLKQSNKCKELLDTILCIKLCILYLCI